MRSVILALTLIVTQGSNALAETTVTLDVGTLYVEQTQDKKRLGGLNWQAAQLRDKILQSRTNFLPLSAEEKTQFQTYVEQTQLVSDRMRVRGQVIFDALETEYELACAFHARQSPECQQAKALYKKIIKDTIIHGGFYYLISVNSNEIATILSQE